MMFFYPKEHILKVSGQYIYLLWSFGGFWIKLLTYQRVVVERKVILVVALPLLRLGKRLRLGKGCPIWLQPGKSAARFCSGEVQTVIKGVRIIRVKPAVETHGTMAVWGMPFCTPDSLVGKMVELYGGKLLSPVGTMLKYMSGPFKGQYNGGWSYKVV